MCSMSIKNNVIAFALLVGALWSCQQTDELGYTSHNTSSPSELDANPSVVQGVLRVQLSRELGDKLSVNSQDGGLRSGNTALDEYLQKIGATSMKRVFPYAGKYEGRTRREGLHLWYDITFDSKTSVLRAIGEAKKLPGIVQTEELYIPQTSESTPRVINLSSSLRSVQSPYNDGGLSLQWHYNNTGNNPYFVAGADINLFKAWEIETGKSNVVVAVVDGGIDYQHEDLKDSMYINELEKNGTVGVDDDGNGYVDDVYGYNFVDMSGTIASHRHGTHVAGTVGARTNNGKGVAGVAGGDGSSGSGVRLMSCQIFMTVDGVSQGTANSPQAIKYGADNGANISQNSWGYRYPGPSTIPASLKAAIDYFIKYAGCDDNGDQLPGSPMKGGVVFFAAGNDYVDYPVQPGPYPPVIAVASHAPDFKVADYSNRGDWVDIIAPGGSSWYAGGEVLSTLPDNKYGYLEGTSMACPHVSGVAALVLSKYGRLGYTASDLRTAILSALRSEDVDAINPKYVGRLGGGYLDAAKAFAPRTNIAPDAVTVAKVLPSLSGLEVSFQAVRDADDLGVAAFYDVYISSTALNSASDLTAESVQYREIQGRRASVGQVLSTMYTNLKSNTLYHFAIVTRDLSGNVSKPYSFSGTTASNQAPVVSRSEDGLIRLSGNMLKDLTVTVNEPEGQHWSYKVTGQTQGVVVSKVDTGLSLRFRAIAPIGQHQVVLSFTDTFGATTSLSIPFEVYANNAPRAVLTSTPIIVPVADRVKVLKLSELFVDDDREPLSLTAQVLRGNVQAKVSDDGELSLLASSAGTSMVSLLAVDPAGATAKAMLEVRFVDNAFVRALYPMPATTTLNVDLAETLTAVRLEVYTTIGQRIMSKDYAFAVGDSRQVALDLSSVLPGTYVLHVLANGSKHTQTFVKR